MHLIIDFTDTIPQIEGIVDIPLMSDYYVNSLSASKSQRLQGGNHLRLVVGS